MEWRQSMDWRKIAALVVLGVGLAAPAAAAAPAALADAMEHRDKSGVRRLLETGAGVNAAQVDGTTALHWAAYHDDAETAAMLVRAGADVNAVNRYGVPPLTLACKNGNAAIVKLLATRFRGGTELLSGPAWALTSALFFAYWLPQLLSAFDAFDTRHAFYKAATALRYLPFLWLVASAVADRRGRRITFGGLAVIAGVWTLDALAQAVSGTSPLFWGLDALKQLIEHKPLCSAQETAAVNARIDQARVEKMLADHDPFATP